MSFEAADSNSRKPSEISSESRAVLSESAAQSHDVQRAGSKPSTAIDLPKLTLFDAGKTSPSPDGLVASSDGLVVKESIDNSGKKMITKQWTSGAQAGEKEDDFADGQVVHYKPDGKGGEFVVSTRADGSQTLGHAVPDGKGGVIYTEEDPGNPSNNRRSYYAPDGTITTDYADGRHVEWKRLSDGSKSITMTGKEAYENYTAVETADHQIHVKYADGSSFDEDKDDHVTVHGRFGGLGILDHVMGSASDFEVGTSWELIGYFWDSLNQAVEDVRRANGSH